MLHDIILGLSGIGGEVLTCLCGSKHRDTTLPQVLSLHPCEETIIEQLKNIADSYRSIVNFTKIIPQFGEEQIILDDGTRMLPGMYLRAFSLGLRESLTPYRTCLVKLEEEILENSDFTVDGILAKVSNFLPLLTTLNSVIKQIVVRQLHGCKILQVIHENLSTGIDMVDQAMAKIMQHCHVVLMRQLTTWCLQGHLIDPYEEFFIISQEVYLENLHSSMTTLDTMSLGETATNEASILEYKVVEDLVPSYIPSSIPTKARFIGSTMALFHSDPRGQMPGPDMKFRRFHQTEPALQAQFRSLQSSKFDVSALEAIVDTTSSVVTEILFSLATGEANLLGELRWIKDIFLLGRGELFVTFLRKANSILLKPVGSTSGKDLSNLLYSSARNVDITEDGEAIMKRFSFKVPHKDTLPSGTTVLSVMTLEFNPNWPLNLHLFTPAALTSYNTLFQFLLQVKIAELNLHLVWIQNVKKKNRSLSCSVWTLHNWLMFLVQNLQSYLQLNVLESQFTTLQNALTTTNNFEQVIHHHSIFLSHIMSLTFLLSKEERNPNQPVRVKRHPVHKVLTKILQLCDTFCAEVFKTQVSEEAMTSLSEALEKNVFILINLNKVLNDEGLNKLVLSLDFNRFFTKRTFGE